MIRVTLAIVRSVNDIKEILCVREQGKSYFMLPGGEKNKEESVVKALHREIKEELGVGAKNVVKIGVIKGSTPDGKALIVHLFTGELLDIPNPKGEIEELVWLTKSSVSADNLTPMTISKVLPCLEKQGIW